MWFARPSAGGSERGDAGHPRTVPELSNWPLSCSRESKTDRKLIVTQEPTQAACAGAHAKPFSKGGKKKEAQTPLLEKINTGL